MSNANLLMKHAEDKALYWLAKLNSSSLTEAQQQEFFQWLESSPLHQVAYLKAEQLWERGAVLERLPKASHVASLGFQQWHGWATACVFILLASVSFFTYLRSDVTEYSYQTAIGEQQQHQLEDGTKVTLNTDSRIHIKLARSSRTVYLSQGEAYFDVYKDSTRPFDVVTNTGVVRVLGTHFSVQQENDDALITVIEGRVALGKIEAKEFVEAVILTANQQLAFSAAKAGLSPKSVDANEALAWRNQRLVYKAERLSKVVADLNRYLPQKISLADAALGDKEVTAVIQLGDIKTTIYALELSLQLQAEFDAAGAITLNSASHPK